MQVIRPERNLRRDAMYNISFNFDPTIPLYQFTGKEVQEQLNEDSSVSLITDTRLHISGLIIDRDMTIDQLLVNYVKLFSMVVNKSINCKSATLDALRGLGYVLAFAAPTPLANEMGRYTRKLEKLGITPLTQRAVQPLSQYPLHYMDLWVSKLQMQPIVAPTTHPSKVYSHMVMEYLANID